MTRGGPSGRRSASSSAPSTITLNSPLLATAPTLPHGQRSTNANRDLKAGADDTRTGPSVFAPAPLDSRNETERASSVNAELDDPHHEPTAGEPATGRAESAIVPSPRYAALSVTLCIRPN